MTKRDELLAVAERCEKAGEGSRELDAGIYHALNPGIQVFGDHAIDRFGFGKAVPHYTTSLDAAMTLVPERYAIENLSWWPFVANGYEGQRMCSITLLAVDHRGFGTGDRYKSKASTPALALCAAALRAQAEMEG